MVALYEWFSPFGLNPWGRQRTKNFSISSALWVVWGRLFSHLVAFKVSLRNLEKLYDIKKKNTTSKLALLVVFFCAVWTVEK